MVLFVISPFCKGLVVKGMYCAPFNTSFLFGKKKLPAACIQLYIYDPNISNKQIARLARDANYIPGLSGH